MSKVPVLPPSGFRDFLPGEAAERLALINTITEIYLEHGFQPIGMSMMENLSTLQGKGGGTDNEKLIFKVLKRGEELQRAIDGKNDLADLGLRFDLTLPLARYCARFREQLPKPFKVFQIGPVWRADRPQKGRFREFFQCDVDIVGAKEIGAEVDCISAIARVFEKLEITGVEVHLSDRRLLAAMKDADLSDAQWGEALVALDKMDKIGPEGVRKEWNTRFGKAPVALDKLISRDARDFSPTDFVAVHAESVESIGAILRILTESGVKAIFNPTLVRGQDYYTGTIFELRHAEVAGALGGGGRYNRLLEIFGSPDTPAFGGSIGFERLHLLLQEKQKTAGSVAAPQIFFALFSENLRSEVTKLAVRLRALGIRTDVFPDAAKLKNQFKYADDRRIPFVAILGQDEFDRKEIKIKDMESRTEETYSIASPEAFALEMEQLCKK